MNKNSSSKTNFSLLLTELNISGTELADVLHIDSSLISKWRRNHRKFRGNSETFCKLVKYIMALDEASGYKAIRSLLVHEFPAAESVNSDVLEVILKKWLITATPSLKQDAEFEKYISQDGKPLHVNTLEFSGIKGRQEAILSILRYGANLNEPQELWCYLQHKEFSFLNDYPYIDNWIMLNLNFLKSENTIYLLQDVSLQGEELASSMLAWLPMYLTGKVNGYFIEELKKPFQSISFLVLKNRISLYQFFNEENEDDNVVFVTESNNINDSLYKILRKHFEKSVPFFSFYYRNDSRQYMKFLSSMVVLDESQYLLMRFPFVNMIPKAELIEILDNNNISREQQKPILNACTMLKQDLRKNSNQHFRYLIPKDDLVHMLQQKKIVLDTISFFSGKPIYITNKRFRDLVQRLSDVLQHDSHTHISELALLNDITVKEMRHLNILVKRDTCISIFNVPSITDEKCPQVITSTELPIINSMFNVCQRLWDTAFPQNRSNLMVARQMEIWLKTIPITDLE